jgi:hypothetical protein
LNVEMARTSRSDLSTRRSFLGLAGKGAAFGAAAVAGNVALPQPVGATTVGTPGGEVGYAETTAPVGTRTIVAVPNLVLQLAPHDRPVSIEFGGYVAASVANAVVKLRLLQGTQVIHEDGTTPGPALAPGHLHGLRRIPPSSTASTISLALVSGTSGATATVLAYASCPAFLLIREL